MYKHLIALVLLACSCNVSAQEGHPLSGTWLGNWGAGDDSNFLTLILSWDGQHLSGLANPGPDSTEVGSVQLDSSSWTVTIDTDLKDDAGSALRFRAEGKLDNVGSHTRTLNGSWGDGSRSGTFTLTRQSGA
jgi:hypothetical protein